MTSEPRNAPPGNAQGEGKPGFERGPSTRTGWTKYDAFAGRGLDSSLWQPVDLGSGPRIEPEARTTVRDGVLTVDVPRFRNCDSTNQGLDNTKHLVLTTQGFRLPPDGIGRFSVELRAEQFDASGDYRHGFATFTVVDMTGGTNLVFNMFSNGARVFAEQEVLEGPGQENPFTRVIEDPFFFSRAASTPDPDFRRCSIEIDRSRGQVVWKIDDEVLHVAAGLTGLPEEVHMAFGIFTLLPIGEGEGSCHGQGGRASWRNFEHSLSAENLP